MRIEETSLPGVLLLEPKVFGDARGFFLETFRRQTFEQAGIPGEFVQDNLSQSCRGTLRGLHYQIRNPQGKLVQVFAGEIFDVAVDLRKNSPTFGRWTGATLSGDNHLQLWIPPGFAHGFCVLSESALMFYKCTDTYHPEHERTLMWNDPGVGIDWPLNGEPVLSEKDQRGLPFDQLECYDPAPDF